MQNNSDLGSAAKQLWKSNGEKDWQKFRNILKKSKAKYYKIVFEKGKVATKEDLRDSYALLYDAKFKEIAKVPIFMVKNKGIEGATIYLEGLLNTNK
jgi:hypothetical protein